MVDISDFEAREKEKFKQAFDLARFCQQENRVEDALNYYVEAIEAYAKYRLFFENTAEMRFRDAGGRGDVDFSSGTPNLLFELSYILVEMYAVTKPKSKNNHITAYIVHKNRLVYETLSQYQSKLHSAQLVEYQKLAVSLKLMRSSEDGDEFLSKLKDVKPEKTDDLKLKTIRVALETISQTKSCPVTLEESGGCFIATAAYMTDTHPDLATFRQLRDKVLLKNYLGRIATYLYYGIGPFLAAHIRNNHLLRQLVRNRLALVAEHLRRYIL